MKSWEELGDFAAQIGSNMLTKGKSFRPCVSIGQLAIMGLQKCRKCAFIVINRQFSDLLAFKLNLLVIGLNFDVF